MCTHTQSPAPLCHQLGGKAWCWQLADLPGAFQWPVPAAAHLPSPWPLRKWRMGTLCRSLVGLRCVLQVYVGFCEGTLGLMALTRCQNPAWSLKRTVSHFYASVFRDAQEHFTQSAGEGRSSFDTGSSAGPMGSCLLQGLQAQGGTTEDRSFCCEELLRLWEQETWHGLWKHQLCRPEDLSSCPRHGAIGCLRPQCCRPYTRRHQPALTTSPAPGLLRDPFSKQYSRECWSRAPAVELQAMTT